MDSILNARFFLPILNGLFGDKMADRGGPFTIGMSLRWGGKNITVDELDPTRFGKKIVVFVHGLMADERMWQSFEHLENTVGVLYVRYNTGLKVSRNGQLFAGLMEQIQKRFKPENIFLAGHSMGGLVIRSACHIGQEQLSSWVKKVNGVFLIAVPNTGASLEKVGYFTTSLFSIIPGRHTKLIGKIIDQRSCGIKDLRQGLKHLPLPKAQYHVLIGRLSKQEHSFWGRMVGDGLVTTTSAAGGDVLKSAKIKTVAGAGHNAILKHPKTVRYVERVLFRGGKF